MALEKYKVCPACGHQNAPNLLECRKCETDLTGVKVVDAAVALKQNTQDVVGEDTLGKVLYRVCDCGEKNPPQARKCRACNEDISDILPTLQNAETAKPFSYSLEAIDTDFSVSFDAPVVVIGREAEMTDFLSTRMYVSRQHAKLTIVAGKVFIENLSRTNKTFINNEPVEDGVPFALSDGDEIGLGGKLVADKRQDNAGYLRFRCNK